MQETQRSRINPDIFFKTVRLAALYLTAEEEALIAPQLAEILNYQAMLDEVDLQGVEPLIHPFDGSELRAREDESKWCNDPDLHRHRSLFSQAYPVPLMLDKEE